MVTAAASDGTSPPPWLSIRSLVGPGGATNRLSEPEATKDDGFKPFGDDGFSFLDLIDVVNPLQHLPVIGPLYRSLTGDTLDPLPRIAGSTLFFGPVGAGISVANVVVEQSTGKDVGGHVLALFDDQASPTTITADASPITDDSKTLAVTAGTDGSRTAISAVEDPVTAWARQELAYRVAEAERRNLIAGNAPSATQPSTEPVALPQIAEAVRPVVAPERPARQSIAAPTPPDAAAFLSGLGVGDVAAALHTLESQKDLAVGAKIESAETSVVELKQATSAYNAAAPIQPARAEPERPAREKPTKSGAIGIDGGWFSASMLGALEKYRDAETVNPSAIGARISETY